MHFNSECKLIMYGMKNMSHNWISRLTENRTRTLQREDNRFYTEHQTKFITTALNPKETLTKIHPIKTYNYWTQKSFTTPY